MIDTVVIAAETVDANRSPDVRDRPRKSKLPCGATHCYRCTEDCGVIVNSYILRDMENEQSQ
jgi:hypothetical protein